MIGRGRLGEKTQRRVLFEEVGPLAVIEASGHELTQTVIALHALYVFFLHACRDRHQLQLDLERLLDAVGENAKDVLAHAARDHGL